MTFPVHFTNVSYRTGRDFALRDLTLRVPQGAVYGLLGPNGCGKTTTIRLLMGMLRPDAGTVVVAGHDMATESHLALAKIGYVPERFHLYSGITVAESIAYHAAFFPAWDRDAVARMLEEFALRPGQVVGAMSKGESGKLHMLLALATRPALLVLDEPTDGLDPVARRDVLASVLGYVAEAGATVLLTSHLVHEVERICDWVGLMDGGTLVREEPMTVFRDGLRRLRVSEVPATLGATPFTLVSRRAAGRQEEWVIRGHGAEATAWLTTHGIEVLEASSMDLEDSVVELLRSARTSRPMEVR